MAERVQLAGGGGSSWRDPRFMRSCGSDQLVSFDLLLCTGRGCRLLEERETAATAKLTYWR